MSKVEREVVVEAPADTVYQVWRNFENLPNFMSNIEAVSDTGHGRSHWRAKGPLGTDVEWDAEIVVDDPGRAIAWRSIESEDSSVRTQGAVRFEEMGDRTRVFVTMHYEAPGGAVGELIAKVFSNPEKQVEEDLARFKEIIESSEGYERATGPVVGHGRPETDRRVNDDAGERTSQVVGKYSDLQPDEEQPEGPGMPERAPGRPTPGGTLGAPTEAELKRNQADISDRTDTRP